MVSGSSVASCVPVSGAFGSSVSMRPPRMFHASVACWAASFLLQFSSGSDLLQKDRPRIPQRVHLMKA